ncbi:MAG: hypothetical protein IKT58_00495 [Oscillospiraceae bacterium]|nr:hypothetical protein [Oscillospiraceae bacterium]
MPTFEQIKEKAVHAVGATADAAKQLALVSKCRIQIAAEQEKIRSLYTKLGKVYYKDFVTDEEPDEAEYQPLCDRISQHYCKISRLREIMNTAKTDYQNMKKDSAKAKAQKVEEEEQLINIVNEATRKDPVTEEEELLEELNNLNNDTTYGEID